MNSIYLIGRLTRTCRLTYTDETARANFTLAVDGYSPGQVSYIPITCFGKTAVNVAEYTVKGHLVCAEGRITSGKYVNDAGEMVSTIDVIASRITFLSRPKTADTRSDETALDTTDAA